MPCFEDKVQVRAFPVRKAQGLQVRAAIHTGVPPQTLALREAIARARPAFAPRPPDGGGGVWFKRGDARVKA